MKQTTRFWVFLITAGMIAVSLAVLGYLAYTAPLQATLRIGADRANSEHYDMANAIAEIVARVHPNLEFEVVETTGSGENIRLLAKREIDLGILSRDAVSRQNASLVAMHYPELLQLLVRPSSGINCVKDLTRSSIA